MNLKSVVTVLGLTVLVCLLLFTFVPYESYENVRSSHKISDVPVIDQNGVFLRSWRQEDNYRSLNWTQLRKTSYSFRDQLVKAEDKRFFSHAGVDLLAFADAAWKFLKGTPYRGASTITMQLCHLIDSSPRRRSRSIIRKIRQMLMAWKLELFWEKNQILEAYINLLPFRGELIGLDTTSQAYFQKSAASLFPHESALLVAMLRSPNSSPARIAKRACHLMKNNQCLLIKALANDLFSQPYHLPLSTGTLPVLNPEFINHKNSQIGVLQTTLDSKIQTLALDAIRDQLVHLEGQNVHDAAVVILENNSGRILGYLGNAGNSFSSENKIDGVIMKRQAGSTLKPFVYATAFEDHFLELNSLVDDAPMDIILNGGYIYHPRNYEPIFRGAVSAAEALASSLNVPAVRVLTQVGGHRVLKNLTDLGFSTPQTASYYGASLALGSLDVSLLELTKAYRNFAVSNKIFSDKTRQQIYEALSSSEYRRMTFGLDSLLSLPLPAAVKTGTSKDMRDNWCIGWTKNYTIGVWVGNFDGSPMWNVSGLSGAAPIWRHLVLALELGHSKAQKSNYKHANAVLKSRKISKISYPLEGMVVAWDPDIPATNQKLPIEIRNPQKGSLITIDETELNKVGQPLYLWSLVPGRHRVALKDSDGKMLHSVNFYVK